MDLSRSSSITYGDMTVFTQKLNEQSDFAQIQQYLRDLFSVDLPETYRVVYYDPTKQVFVDLEEQLQQGYNPFQIGSSMGVRHADIISPHIHFFITKDSAIDSILHPQAEMSIFHHIDDSSSSSQTNSQSMQTGRTNFSRELEACVPTELSNSSIATDYDAAEDNSRYFPSVNQTMTSCSNIRNFLIPRLCFSLDVKPNQKDIYRSDQFSINPTKYNGLIARIQGVKEESQKMCQMLPRLRIPSIYRQSDTTLLVFVANEQFVDGMRVWYKHSHKGFLPENYTKDTKTVNPIEFDLNQCILIDDGELKLNLAMITKWNKSSDESEQIYQLAEDETLRVHRATHDPCSPRLLCVLRQHGRIIWETFCLSDFVRSQRPPKQAYSKVTTGQTSSPVSKRLKNDG